ncbi:MAG: hypothetical protein ACRD23_13620 [Terriglobales bacterium]
MVIGAEAGAANTQQNRVKQAQGQSDEQRLRQYTTTKQNYDMLSMATTNATLGDERLKAAAQTFQPLHDWITSEAANDPTIAAAIHGDELSADELHDLFAKEDGAHVTRDVPFPAGVRPEMKDGKPTGKLEQTWMAIANDGKIKARVSLTRWLVPLLRVRRRHRRTSMTRWRLLPRKPLKCSLLLLLSVRLVQLR